MNAAMIRNTCKMWCIWPSTDLLFSTEFAMISITALRRGNSVGKGRMFCAEYDPGHDREDYFLGWQFVPFLTLASMCTCLNNFLNSVYVVYKRSNMV